MSKLSPKYERENPRHSWEYLDHILQSNMKMHGHAVIKHTEYAMSKDEIIIEAENQGYEVTLDGDHLRFK